jgi:cyanophycin synthetase
MTEELSSANKEFLGSIAQHCLTVHGIVVAELRITTPSLRYSLLRSIEDGETFIRLSLAPDVRLYQLPTSGRGYNIAQNLLAALFPPEKPKHIPIVAITAGIGGDLLATMLDDALTDFGYTVGRATSEAFIIRKEVIRQEPNTTASSILQALAHPAIDCAVLEIPLETIMREGLCYDRAEVGVVLNIAENALNDGEVADIALETREDVAHAHALVAEYLHDGSVSVLNANNPLITRTVERHDNETIFFATSRMNPRLLLHCSRGGRAVLLDAETVIMREGKQETVLVRNVRLDAALDKDLLLALAASLLAFGIPTRKLQTWLTSTIERMSDDKE